MEQNLEPQRPRIGTEEVRRAADILRRYHAGKRQLEQRIIDNEQFWKLRHWQQMEKTGQGGNPADPQPTSGWLVNCILSKHADAMDCYPEPTVLPRELVSRIRSVLRRCGRDKAVVTLGDVQADIERGQVTKNGADVYLTALEYRLLLVFVNNRGKVLSRSRLLEEIWDVAGDFVNDNTLTVYIKRLREKIETDPAAPQIIRTVRGLGYRVEL